jgi:(1->4)-alpha-D-glucan 1-alpha-D-glucosylmutase
VKDARQRPLCVFRRDLAPGQCSGLDSSTAEHLVLLGTTHCRLSPPCTRRPADRETSGKGDEGGADTSCPGIDAIAAAAARLHADGLGVILDVAPGYIALDAEGNQWWYDVLENGRASPFARYFDIDWDPVKRELKDRILLPILDDQYGAVLERGDLRLGFDDGRVSLDCWYASWQRTNASQHTWPRRSGSSMAARGMRARSTACTSCLTASPTDSPVGRPRRTK